MSRHNERQKALQILFSREFHGENDIQYAETEILEVQDTQDEQPDSASEEGTSPSEADAVSEDKASASPDYYQKLVESVHEHVQEIDGIIAAYSKRWTMSQMNRTDKNVLRLSLCELLYPIEPIDVSIVLNEAVLLAREFGGPESSKFVNGILGAYVRSRS
jgi:N utilization substance protein B